MIVQNDANGQFSIPTLLRGMFRQRQLDNCSLATNNNGFDSHALIASVVTVLRSHNLRWYMVFLTVQGKIIAKACPPLYSLGTTIASRSPNMIFHVTANGDDSNFVMIC